MSFGDWLRRQIEDRLLSVSSFAATAGLSRECVHRILAGNYEHRMRGVTVARIAKALSLPRSAIEKQLPTVGNG